MNKLETIESYEYFIYTIREQYPQIKISNLVLKRTGALVGELMGTLTFENNIRLIVKERLDLKIHRIKVYSYEVWRGKEKLYYYDPQPHPDDINLASSYPHHKHLPPDIKHNRFPSPELSFRFPNLPFLIQEIIDNLL